MESGDLSPLLPLSARDLIWLRAARPIREKEKAETEKAMLDLKLSIARRNYLVFCDLRAITFGLLGYDKSAVEEKWNQLPSMVEAGMNVKPKCGMSRGVREMEKQKNGGEDGTVGDR